MIVTPTVGEVPVAAEELNAEISDMYPLVEVPELLREVHEWTGFANLFTHAFAIRKQVIHDMTLDDYVELGGLDDIRVTGAGAPSAPGPDLHGRDPRRRGL